MLATMQGFSQKTKTTASPQPYYPPAGQWERKTPESFGLNADSMQAAIRFAISNEIKNPRSMEENHYRTFGKETFGDGIGPFASAHNRTITWDNLLRQTSDWEGTLWDKPEWADRPDADPKTWTTRARYAPGTRYEYNDVRVNALALAATSVWRQPLPVVLKNYLMDKIGASHTWRWAGYRNSWIVLDGQPVQSVSGGGHWGGGMFINAWDMARFGLLTLRKGKWNSEQILSEQWLQQATTPTPVQTDYTPRCVSHAPKFKHKY